jgi:hypothetical protein
MAKARSRKSPRRSRKSPRRTRKSPRRSRKSPRRSRKSPRRTRSPRRTSHKFLSDDSVGLGNCRGKKKRICRSDPNCSYRKRVGCVGRKGTKAKGAKKYYGPTLEGS